MVFKSSRPDMGRILQNGNVCRSKSGGELHVMLQLNKDAFAKFFACRETLRIYRISEIPKGGRGAGEFHKRRSEIITVEKGSFRVLLEDVLGNRKSVSLREKMTFGVVRPYILHTYIALSDKAALHVIANTLYDLRKPSTYDTYSEGEFRRLQLAACR